MKSSQRAPEPETLVFESEPAGVRFLLRPGETVLVGRRDADVVVPYVTVGRRHARLDYRTGTCLLEDAGSPGGTFLNELAVGQPQPIAPGDRIRLGHVTLVVRSLKGQSGSTPATAE